MTDKGSDPPREPHPGDPARCKRCGHEGTLPPLDPETGKPRFECPICGHPTLAVLDPSRPKPKPAFRWGVQPRKREAVPTIYSPPGPRPRGLVAGSLADLRALFWTTLAVLHAGTPAAFFSLFVMTPFAVLLWAVAAGANWRLTDFCVCTLLPPIAFGFAFVWAVPLAAYGAVALGGEPTVRGVLNRAFVRAPLLAGTIALSIVAAIFAVAIAGFFLEMSHGAPVERRSALLFLFALPVQAGVGIGFIWLYLRNFLLSHLLAVIAEPGDKLRAISEAPELTRGRVAMLGVVAAAPIVIQLVATPTPFTQDILANVLGQGGAELFGLGAALLGWTVSVFLGSALLASALAVILATPLEETR